MSEVLLNIKNLNKVYCSSGDLSDRALFRVQALDNLSLQINKGEIFAIAGESGCGKTTLGRCITLLEVPSSGEIYYNGINIQTATKSEIKSFRKKVQMIFQNPYSSLNPKMSVFDILKEPLVINKYQKKDIPLKVEKILSMVGMDVSDLKKYPHEFSGGQRQRIAIARALILEPELVIADEPVSALDVSIQAQIITLLLELKEKLNLTILFISHDLRVIRHIANRVAIMYAGQIVEQGDVDSIFLSPVQQYTKNLLAAIPKINKCK